MVQVWCDGAMADNRAWTAGRYVARELADIIHIFNSRDALALRVDEATSTLIVSAGHHNELWIPIRKGKIYEAQVLARVLLRERDGGHPASLSYYDALGAMLQPT
jgi:hypothetical protein